MLFTLSSTRKKKRQTKKTPKKTHKKTHKQTGDAHAGIVDQSFMKLDYVSLFMS